MYGCAEEGDLGENAGGLSETVLHSLCGAWAAFYCGGDSFFYQESIYLFILCRKRVGGKRRHAFSKAFFTGNTEGLLCRSEYACYI